MKRAVVLNRGDTAGDTRSTLCLVSQSPGIRWTRSLAVWLEECGVTHVAMESTGVFWKPIHNVLEGHAFTLLVVNAPHMKAIPGKKTDVKDAEWIADLLRHGLLTASFVPSRAERERRELVRYRKSLVRERAAESNRVQKVLEGGPSGYRSSRLPSAWSFWTICLTSTARSRGQMKTASAVSTTTRSCTPTSATVRPSAYTRLFRLSADR